MYLAKLVFFFLKLGVFNIDLDFKLKFLTIFLQKLFDNCSIYICNMQKKLSKLTVKVVRQQQNDNLSLKQILAIFVRVQAGRVVNVN